MQTMDQSLRDLYQKGLVSYDEAVSRAMNPEEFKTMVSTATRSNKAGNNSAS